MTDLHWREAGKEFMEESVKIMEEELLEKNVKELRRN